MGNALRARFDAIIVLEEPDPHDAGRTVAVQYELSTTLRDQLEVHKRFPKIETEPATAPMRLVWCAAQRLGIIPADEEFDAWVDRTLDFQLEELAPLTPR